jgi:hypothetical protein
MLRKGLFPVPVQLGPDEQEDSSIVGATQAGVKRINLPDLVMFRQPGD